MLGPLSKVHGFAMISYWSILHPIVVLNITSCPATIFLTIMACSVVNSINAIFRARFFAHITIKSKKIISPFFANLNTPATISFKACITRSIASFYHSNPGFELRRMGHAMLFCFVFRKLIYLFMETSATLRVPTEQRCRYYYSFIAADTSATKIGAPDCIAYMSRPRGAFNNSKAPKNFPRQINKIVTTTFRHLIALSNIALEDASHARRRNPCFSPGQRLDWQELLYMERS